MDRTGIALLSAIAMVVFGVITPESAFHAIDLPTSLLLYSLMKYPAVIAEKTSPGSGSQQVMEIRFDRSL